MENHYIVQTVMINGDLSKCVQPVYPAGWEENHDKYDFNNPMWAMLNDMDDPYKLGLFIKKFEGVSPIPKQVWEKGRDLPLLVSTTQP